MRISPKQMLRERLSGGGTLLIVVGAETVDMPANSKLSQTVSLVNSSTCLLCSVIDLLVENPRTKRIVKIPIIKWRCLAVLTISVGHL